MLEYDIDDTETGEEQEEVSDEIMSKLWKSVRDLDELEDFKEGVHKQRLRSRRRKLASKLKRLQDKEEELTEKIEDGNESLAKKRGVTRGRITRIKKKLKEKDGG